VGVIMIEVTYQLQPAGQLRLLLLAGLLLLALLAGLLLASSEVEVVLEMRMASHALLKHGAEATAIRQCLEGKGPSSVWEFTSHKRDGFFILTCRMDDGRWGIQIIQRTKIGRLLEKTAFVIKDGSLFQLKEYVTARAVEFIGDVTLLGL